MAEVYVAPTGSNANPGTIGSPFATLKFAHDNANPGDLIYLRGGTYPISTTTVLLTNDGASGNLIRIFAYPGETPVFDMIASTAIDDAGFVLTLSSASFNHLKGIEVKNGSYGGIAIRGSSNGNIIEQCVSHHNGRNSDWEGKGFVLYGSSANNLLLNNDSHHNRDLQNDNADGFQIGSTGTGNVLRGNRAWFNSDDGYDLFNVQDNTIDGTVLLENNWAWRNGFDDALNPLGDGTGFKLGGRRAATTGTSGGHTARNCVAWSNRVSGFSENEAQVPLTLYNNTSYNNQYNYEFWDLANTFRNNISLAPGLIEANGSATTNSWTLAVTVNSADFQSLSDTGADGARQADGSLPNIPFLRLVSGSDLRNIGVNVGIPFDGSAPDLGAFELVESVVVGSRITELVEDAVPDAATDWFTFVDVSDLTMAPTGTNQKVHSDAIPVSAANGVAGSIQRKLKDKFGETLSVKDFDAIGNGIADDTAELNAAFAYGAINNRAIYMPDGIYVISDTLWATPHGSSTLGFHIYGDGGGFGLLGGGPRKTLIDARLVTGKPAIATYHHRAGIFRDFGILGPNSTPNNTGIGSYRFGPVTGTFASGSATTAVLPNSGAFPGYPDDFFVGWVFAMGTPTRTVTITDYVKSTRTLTFATGSAVSSSTTFTGQGWVADGVRDSRWSPQCGIGINIGRGPTPPDGGYAGVTYAGESSGSHGTIIEGLAIEKCVAGILIGPDNDANDDDIQILNTSIIYTKVGVANCHAQSRSVVVRGKVNGYCRTAFDTTSYGAGNGAPILVDSTQVGPAFEIFNFDGTIGAGVLDKIYVESVHRLGNWSRASGSLPLAIDNSSLHFVNHATARGPGPLLPDVGFCDIALNGNDIYYDARVTNRLSFAGQSDGGVTIRACKLIIESAAKPIILRDNGDLISVITENVQVCDSGGGSVLLGRTGRRALPVRVTLNGEPFVHSLSASYKVTPGSATGPWVNFGFNNFTKGVSQFTFIDVDARLFQVGDEIAVRTTQPLYGTTTIVVRAFGLKVVSVVGTTITCDPTIDMDYINPTQDAMYFYRQEWAPSGLATATTTIGSMNLTNCTAGLYDAVLPGDRIKGTGLDPVARVVSKSGGTTIAMNSEPTASASNVPIYYAQLTLL